MPFIDIERLLFLFECKKLNIRWQKHFFLYQKARDYKGGCYTKEAKHVLIFPLYLHLRYLYDHQGVLPILTYQSVDIMVEPDRSMQVSVDGVVPGVSVDQVLRLVPMGVRRDVGRVL